MGTILQAPAATPTVESGPSRIERETFVMGTRLRVRVEAGSRTGAVRATEAAISAIRQTDELLSTWRTDTELAAVNATPLGTPFHPSVRLFRLLSEVAGWQEATAGAFDPAVGALLETWDLRGRGRRPTPQELRRALLETGWRCFHLEETDGTVERRCPDAWIDAGAFGKGAALREAGRELQADGVRTARLDFGGQLLLLGVPPGGGAWSVAVAHPSDRERPVVWLRVPGGSVATTSLSERWVEVEGERVGHVVDPRTGRPVPAWGSVTVLSDDPLVADLLSTALFVMGPREGLAWADREAVAALFLITRNGSPLFDRSGSSASGPDGTGDVVVRTSRAMRPRVAP